MNYKTLAAATIFGAMTLGSSTAEATVMEPDASYWVFVASPGIASAAAALVTTSGAAASLDADTPQTGWAATGVVFGTLSIISGAVYGGFAAETNSDEIQSVFVPVSVANITLGISSVTLGVMAATMDTPPEEKPWIPHVSVDPNGGGYVGFRGSF